MTRIRPAALALLIAALAPALPAAAEETPARAEKEQDVTWSFSAEMRLRPEYRDDRDLDGAVDDDTRLGLMRLRVGVAAAWRDDVRVFFQAQDSRVAGEEPSTGTNTKNLDLHQGYVELKRLGVTGLGLTAGRQEWKYGEERMIGAFGWDNVGRSFDGVKVSWARGRYFVDGLAAQVANTVAGTGTEGSGLYGIEYQTAARKSGEYGAYWLDFTDNVAADGELGVPGDTTINAFGGRMKDRFGGFDLNAEAAIETGRFHGDDLSAWAGAVQGGYTFGTERKIRLFAGYDFATGDEDPNDGEREEFFNFFPTNHLHYGYMDYEGWRNIESPWGGVSFAVGRHFAQAKAHHFALHEAAGAWKDAAGNVMGADPAGRSTRNVGMEYDLTYRYRWTEKAAVEGGYGRFEPGTFAKATRGDDPSDWAYVSLTIGI